MDVADSTAIMTPIGTVRLTGVADRLSMIAIDADSPERDGETVTYGALARTHESAARAIGGVCRTNPFPIVVPCHRVVSAGKTDYYSAGTGPTTKAWLLAHERGWRRRWER